MQISTTYVELTVFFTTNRQRLLNFLKAKVNEPDAQDILHNAFINAVQNLHRFQGKARLSTWFNTILRNLVYAHYNQNRRFNQVQREIVNHNLSQPFEHYFPNELKCILQKAINSLPNANQREIIKLRYYEHLKLSQIYKILQTTYKAVEIQHRRALKCLKYLILKDPCYRGLVEYVKAKGFKICQG